VGERKETRMEPALREILLSEPDIVAWLELPEHRDDTEDRAESAPAGGS